MTRKPVGPGAVDIDALLQDSYLLVVSLRQNGTLEEGGELWERCTEQVERTRAAMREAGLSERARERISYAQCALLDETVLGQAKSDAHAQWAAQPLQAHFFKRHEAGVQLYEDIREALAEPAPERSVLTCYQRVLLLGFEGRYRGADAGAREALLDALSEQVAPFAGVGLPLLLPGRRRRSGRWRSAWLLALVAGLALAALWWGLDLLLSNAVGSLLPPAA